jgi:hypothetical protein
MLLASPPLAHPRLTVPSRMSLQTSMTPRRAVREALLNRQAHLLTRARGGLPMARTYSIGGNILGDSTRSLVTAASIAPHPTLAGAGRLSCDEEVTRHGRGRPGRPLRRTPAHRARPPYGPRLHRRCGHAIVWGQTRLSLPFRRPVDRPPELNAGSPRRSAGS